MLGNRESYFEALDEVKNICQIKFADEICSVYVGGSVARGDFVPGRSDIDLYIVLKSNEIQNKLQLELEKIKSKEKPISVAYTTKKEVIGGQSFLGSGFEYNNFIREGKLIYGQEIKDRIPKPTREEEIKTADQCLKFFEASYKDYEEEVIERYFSATFRTLCIVLSGKGIYVSSKKDVVTVCNKKFKDRKLLNEKINVIYDLWITWGRERLTQEQVCTLLKACDDIMPLIFDLWESKE
ncbi:nucleotidyltransferase domain-containing protein [Proteinivorax hydrogeniformans]|uniref:Nucleotidyltransferase domain-containing protein n=1 Tax=Proteinivorax hydrogeniformans TaxID=1826727 RepID=A0AAU8HSI5_9FIRM